MKGFSLDPEIFIELNESIQTEIFILLSTESIVNILKRLESDNALKILENLDEKKKNTVLDKLPPRIDFYYKKVLVIQKILLHVLCKENLQQYQAIGQ